MEHIYIPKHKYKVLVHTITYNQAKYITDTLDGVAMQQTNFSFVHYVIDDCSTDGEQDVIKNWLNEHCDMDKAEYIDLELANVILVPHKTNLNLTFAIYLLKRNLWKEQELKGTLVDPWRDHCEYEALCEGDDYWTHLEKLQKQVDWMESNPQCSMVWSDAKIINCADNDSVSYFHRADHDCDFPVENYIIGSGGFCPTASLLVRMNLLVNMPEELKGFHVGDYPLQMYMAMVGEVRYFAEPMCVYRLQSIGSWSSNWLSWDGENAPKRLRNDNILIEAFNRWSKFKYDTAYKERWYLTLNDYYMAQKRYKDALSIRRSLIIANHNFKDWWIWLKITIYLFIKTKMEK